MGNRTSPAACRYFVVAAALALAAVPMLCDLPSMSKAPSPPAALLDLAKPKDDPPALNVLFVLVDTLRADRLGLYGYERPTSPNIDTLGSTGIVFEDVVAQSTWTKTSMASLWTATNPARNGVLRFDDALPDEATLAAEVFQAAGFRTAGIWRNGWVAPNFGFAQGFDIYVRPTPGRERAQVHRTNRSPVALVGTDEDALVAAMDFLDRFGDERFFLYLHLMDVHQYTYDGQAAIFGTAYSDAYDQAIRWTDRLVGVLVAYLEANGLRDNTLIVIGADHGEAFREHGFEGHARNLYRETTHVPLILAPPLVFDPPIRVREPISNASLWPTVLDLLGLPPLPGADGISLVDRMAGFDDPARAPRHDPEPIFSQLAVGWGNPRRDPVQMIAATCGHERLIQTRSDPVVHEYYDHAADPLEQDDMARVRTDRVVALEQTIATYLEEANPPWGAKPERVELEKMRLNQLRALGYVIEP